MEYVTDPIVYNQFYTVQCEPVLRPPQTAGANASNGLFCDGTGRPFNDHRRPEQTHQPSVGLSRASQVSLTRGMTIG